MNDRTKKLIKKIKHEERFFLPPGIKDRKRKIVPLIRLNARRKLALYLPRRYKISAWLDLAENIYLLKNIIDEKDKGKLFYIIYKRRIEDYGDSSRKDIPEEGTKTIYKMKLE